MSLIEAVIEALIEGDGPRASLCGDSSYAACLGKCHQVVDGGGIGWAVERTMRGGKWPENDEIRIKRNARAMSHD